MPQPVDYIQRITDNYAKLGYKAYQWVRTEERPPWQPLQKPLSVSTWTHCLGRHLCDWPGGVSF